MLNKGCKKDWQGCKKDCPFEVLRIARVAKRIASYNDNTNQNETNESNNHTTVAFIVAYHQPKGDRCKEVSKNATKEIR